MPVVIELMGEGRRLADEIGCRLCAVVCGENVDRLTYELGCYGADVVYSADDPRLRTYTTDAYTKVIYEAVTEYKPEILLLGATHIGRDLGPSIAVKCGTGLTADCTKLDINAEDKKAHADETRLRRRISWPRSSVRDIARRWPPFVRGSWKKRRTTGNTNVRKSFFPFPLKRRN